MKIVSEKVEEEILVSDITKKHIVVGVIDGCPVILTLGEFDNFKSLKMMVISEELIRGNSYHHSDISGGTLGEIIINSKKFCDKIACLHQDNWKDALKWLIDNA